MQLMQIKRLWKNRFLLLLTMPMVVFIFIFKYVPMVGAIVAFKHYQFNKGIFGSEWIGLTNFRFLAGSPDLQRLLRNTIGYNLSFIIFTLICAVLLAILLYEISSKRALKLYQTVIFIPHFLSWVVIAFMVYAFLNMKSGMLNQWFDQLGWAKMDWYNSSKPWVFIFPISHIWKEVGVACIIYYAGLMGIDPTYFEAAKIDGASRLQMILRISLPFLYPIMSILTILAIGNILEADFGLFYQLPMNSPSILSTTDVLDTYVFRALIELGDIGMSSAAGLAKSVVGFLLVIAANALVRRANSDNSLF
ncbi:ABC transporter permease subunit [Paenibacillus sp. HB172176]|uniref:ABC transporter permease n=1 Tax=Paenibacillus sp. HB172176 TaxID=2493690 RepID=UPI001F1104AC|nr:ABC transporter permease subunit [Paenibacillus sp. HB172176]